MVFWNRSCKMVNGTETIVPDFHSWSGAVHMTRFRSKNRSKNAIFEQIGQNLKRTCSYDKFCLAKFVEKVIFCLYLSSIIWLRQELVLKFALFSRQHVACVGSIPWSHEMIRERTKTQLTPSMSTTTLSAPDLSMLLAIAA
jgi:hypothetical protein